MTRLEFWVGDVTMLLSGGGWWWWVVERVREIKIRERSVKYFYIILRQKYTFGPYILGLFTI